jgi:hypothetical protein
MTSELQSYLSGMAAIIKRVKSGDIKTPQDGNKAVGEYKNAIHQMEKLADEFAKEGVARMSDAEIELKSKAATTVATIITFSVIAVAAGLVLSLLIGRNYVRSSVPSMLPLPKWPWLPANSTRPRSSFPAGRSSRLRAWRRRPAASKKSRPPSNKMPTMLNRRTN